jgi:hypothetical protein
MVNDDDKPVLLTNDKNTTQDEIEWRTQGQTFKITSREFPMELARVAKETYDHFEREIWFVMTLDRALRIKELRKIYSWRSLASAIHEERQDDACWSHPATSSPGWPWPSWPRRPSVRRKRIGMTAARGIED